MKEFRISHELQSNVAKTPSVWKCLSGCKGLATERVLGEPERVPAHCSLHACALSPPGPS